MPTLQDYLNLIPPPNRIQPKFMAWLSACLQPLVDTQVFIDQIIEAFDIETAVGDQLDILGQILNRSRVLNFQPSTPFSAVNAIPVLVNYDTPTIDLTIYQEVGKSVYLVGMNLVTETACNVTFKSGSTSLITYQLPAGGGRIEQLIPYAPAIVMNTETSQPLIINCNQTLPPFQVYVVTA